MVWVQTVSSKEFNCYENNTKSMTSRIESRKSEGSSWIIYRSFINKSGLNFTEEYTAATDDKMLQIISTLKRTKAPTNEEIKKLILEQSKKVSLNIEREFKEYNVEKWKFGVNNSPSINFALVRTYDEIDIDIILHDSYKTQEQQIIQELIAILGFDGMEDVVTLNCYYFQKSAQKNLQSTKHQTLDLF